jgi:acyl-CoA dehydrogenase
VQMDVARLAGEVAATRAAADSAAHAAAWNVEVFLEAAAAKIRCAEAASVGAAMAN